MQRRHVYWLLATGALLVLLIGVLLVFLITTKPEPAPPKPPYLAAVWAVGDGDKIERESTEPPRVSLVWDGKRVKLFAARNEIVAFQLMVRAGGGGVRELRAALPELTLRGGTSRITYAPPAEDPSDYRGRAIQVFPVNYMNVGLPSDADWIYAPGSSSVPADPTGWKPVQLVPENARAGKGGFPLSVRAHENQAIWFDVYIGRDHPAGIYEGAITVTADGGSQVVPVELEVLDFALPDESTLTAMVYYESSQPLQYQGQDLDAVYHRFAHRQRIELVTAYDVESAQAAIGRFRGADFTASAGYEGPGEGVGNRLAPRSFYSPGPGWDDRATAWQRSDAWITFLERKLPGAITFLYMPDEPSPEQYPEIRTIADNIHSNPGPGRRLPIFVTRPYLPELEGAIDIWASIPREYDPAKAAKERAKGRDWWIYYGGRPHGPAIVIDAPGTDPRVLAWSSFKAGIPVYFHWHSVHWYHNHQKRSGDRLQNVWANPITFDTGDVGDAGYRREIGNGEGVLIYPGTEKIHPEEDRGIAGPIATIQLANLRRGLQDHMYLTLARRRGLDALVEESVKAIVPRPFGDTGPTVSFPETTDAFERVRLCLGRALAAPR